MCHGKSGLTVNRGGRSISLYVDESRLKNSAHAPFSCVDCHVGLNPAELPHAKPMKPAQCRTCHETGQFEKSVHGQTVDQVGNEKIPLVQCKACHGTHDIRSFKDPKSAINKLNIPATCGGECHSKEQHDFSVSPHAEAVARGERKSPSCVDCHGAHNINAPPAQTTALFKTEQDGACLKCHLGDPGVRKEVGTSAGFMAVYETSAHGLALKNGNAKAAGCIDCHDPHRTKRASDPLSRVNKWNISQTCSRCHADIARTYNESIHGAALRSGKADVPTCTDCHGEHQIIGPNDPSSPVSPRNVSVQVCARCHNSVQLNRKYGLPSEQFNSFQDSYHGLASRAGSVAVANCASCHGVHNIKPSSDPSSTVSPANLAATCGRCHPGANTNFARAAVHVVAGSRSGNLVLYWIRAIYIGLIIVVIGGMFFHNFLDFVDKARDRLGVRQGRTAHAQHGSTQYVRMTLNDRIQHATMFISFGLLAVTGFMLKFPDAWWVVPIRQISPNFFEVRGILHRVAAVAMIAISLYHLCHIIIRRQGRRFALDMLPRLKDVGDAWANLRHLLGLSKNKPLFDRFSYVEKAEYWALVWGVMIMSATGIVMWFDNYFMRLWTKLGWDIARSIHFYEAVLATLAIIVWHFYFVIFRPTIYPMSTAWLTGRISEEEMAEEHPLEFDRIISEQRQQDSEPRA
jgi:cytochrome b subunit of formate dehydrogenase